MFNYNCTQWEAHKMYVLMYCTENPCFAHKGRSSWFVIKKRTWTVRAVPKKIKGLVTRVAPGPLLPGPQHCSAWHHGPGYCISSPPTAWAVEHCRKEKREEKEDTANTGLCAAFLSSTTTQGTQGKGLWAAMHSGSDKCLLGRTETCSRCSS